MSIPKKLSRTQEWTIYIHDMGNMIHNSPGNFGGAYSYTDISSSNNVTVFVIHEVSKKVVSYLNDEKTPCQPMPRTVELDTCIQNHLQNEMGCQLPWSKGSSKYPDWTESGQYSRYLQSYQDITRLTERSIAERTGERSNRHFGRTCPVVRSCETCLRLVLKFVPKLVSDLHSNCLLNRTPGCLPSCQRNEFTANVVNRAERPSKPAGFFAVSFFYASGRYVEKTYYYVYDWVHLLADLGGYMGLLLGFSLLSIYDGIKGLCKMCYALAMQRRAQALAKT